MEIKPTAYSTLGTGVGTVQQPEGGVSTSAINAFLGKELKDEDNSLSQTPDTDHLSALYMQHADGNTHFFDSPNTPDYPYAPDVPVVPVVIGTGTVKDGVISLHETINIDKWVGDLLEADPENEELKKAKNFTEMVLRNRDKIGSLDGEAGISEKDLELAFGVQPHLTGDRLLGQTFDSDTSLRNANLELADLRFTDIRRTDLSGANLRGTNFKGADISRVDFSGANLEGTNLSEANIHNSWYDENTIFPAGFDPSQHDMRIRNPNTNLSGIYDIETSGTYNAADIGETDEVFIDGDNLNVTFNGDSGTDKIVSRASRSDVTINTGDGNDEVSVDVIEPRHPGMNEPIVGRETHTVIDGGDGYDVFSSDFLANPDATYTKHEDGSYTITSGNDVITLKNFEGFQDTSNDGGIAQPPIIEI